MSHHCLTSKPLFLPARCLLSTAMVLLIAVSSLTAQSDTAVYVSPPVIVTASRIYDTWLKLPVAITVVNLGDSQVNKGAGIDEALTSIPGLLAQSRTGGSDVRLSMRGFGSRGSGERSNAGTSRGLRILLDGLPLTEPDGRTAFDLIDLSSIERIEVVRSNSSTAWGNASGGVINFVSSSDREFPSVMVQSTLGSYGYRKEVVTTHVPVGSGNLALTLTNTNSDGWREQSGSTRSFVNANLTSLVGPSSLLEVSLVAASNLYRIPGPLTQSQFDVNPRQAQDDPANYDPTYVERDERRFNRLGRLGVKLEHEFDANNGLAITAFASPKYLQRSERNTFRDFTRYHIGGSALFHRASQVSLNTKNAIVVGLDGAYQDGAILFYNLDNGNRGETVRSDKREGAGNLGVFFEDRIVFEDKYQVNARLRYDNIVYSYDDHLNPKLNDSRSFSRMSPWVGFSVILDSSRSVYLSYGGGVEVPAGNETDPPSTFGEDTLTSLNPLLEPIKSTTLELGAKCMSVAQPQHFVSRFSYDVSLFWINITDDIIPYRSGRFHFTAGKTRRLGIEVGGTADLNIGMTLSASATYMHSRYVDYTVDSVYYGVPGAFADYSDNEMAGIPSVSYSAKCRYEPAFAGSFYVESAVQGIDNYYADDANRAIVPAYNTIDFTAGATQLRLVKNGPFLQLSIGVRNLFDKRYAASAFVNPDRSSANDEPIYLEPGLPRNWFTSIALRWEL